MPVVLSPGSALAAIKVEDEVTYNIGGVVYAGKIRAITPDDIRPYGIGLEIDCQDFTSLLNDDICAYANVYADPVRRVVETDLQRINWLLQSWGRDGITAYNVQTLYAAMPMQDFTGMTLYDAIKDVLKFSGGSFYVDFRRDLHTFISETVVAPFALSDSPDGVASFGYADFQYPQDSVDLRNAVYGIPGPIPPPMPTVVVMYTSSLAAAVGASGASFKPAGTLPIREVARGAFTTGSNTSVSPLFGQATGAGNLLVALVSSTNSGGSVVQSTAVPGWIQVRPVHITGNTPDMVHVIWYKPNCAAGESAPTFTDTGGLTPMFAQLLEFFGVALNAPVENYGGTGAGLLGNPITLPVNATLDVAGAHDAVLGNLVVAIGAWEMSGSQTLTAYETYNANVGNELALAQPIHLGDSGAVARTRHFSFSYAIIPTGARWYTNEASIALSGRREASFSDDTVTTKAALDALGAAYLAEHASPLRQASCMVDQVGLAAGQIVNVTNALHGLSASPFRIQSVETNYSDNVPRFKVEFADPAITVSTQIVALREQLTSKTTAITESSNPLGIVGYAEIFTDQLAVGNLVDITGLTVSVSTGASRRIKVTAKVIYTKHTAGLLALDLFEGPDQLDQWIVTAVDTGQYTATLETILNPSAGGHTYKLVVGVSAGTADVKATATSKAFIKVEDVGVA